MKNIFLLIALLCSFIGANAQTGSVKGSVKTADNQPVAFANVVLKNTNKGATTDSQGQYDIKNVQEGNYTLVVTFVGATAQETEVEVKANETTSVPSIALKENIAELNEVVIQTNRDNKDSDYVSKMPLKNTENPQVYNVVETKTLKEQVVTNFDDALKNVPGMEKLWESTGRGGDGAGYYSLRGFSVQPTLVNGLPGLTNGSLDVANIEKIEVVKGPSGTLFGSSLISYGGLINTITKKPYQGFGGEVTYITGSYGLHRVAADINTPLSSAVALRVNTSYHSQQSFQDAGFKKSFFIAPSLSFKANEKLSFLLQTEFLSAESTNQTMLFLNRSNQVAYKNLEELGYDYRKSYTSDNLSIKNPRFNLQAQMLYKLSDKWTSQTVLSTGTAKTDGYYTYLWDFADGHTFGRYLQKQNATTLSTDIQQNFIGDFNIGSLRNRVLIGLDYFHRNMANNNTGWVGLGMVVDGVDSGNLTQAVADAAVAPSAFSSNKTKEEVYSAYISDVLNITPKFSVMLSLRADHFHNHGDITNTEDNFEQTTLSPKFGLVYQPIQDKLSVFVNYMNGFSNVSPTQKYDIDGDPIGTQTFKPEQANQMEFGIKTNLFDNKLISTFSYYDIQVSNRVMSAADGLNSVQGGKVGSSGFEVDLTALPISGWNIMLGYSYNESEVLEGNEAVFYQEKGRRLSDAGPQNLLTAWTTYQFTKGALQGFGLGFGVNAASERLILDSSVTGTFALPAYTILNASLFYKAEKFNITLKMDNLTDEEYYKGWSTINPQMPRNLMASFGYKF
jgi:iron complex outermembrane recepter protein